MRKLLLILCFAAPALLHAQVPNTHARPDSVAFSPVHFFYSRYGLNPDSAQTPQLYYDVYSWIGTHYHYGGHSRSGIDCSGFVAEMYRSVYCIIIAGGAKSLYTQVDTVSKKDLKEGDILFFKIRKGQVSHVGIYLGNNKFAHASVHGGVMIDDLDKPYYKKYFLCGGRLKKPVTMK
jgi:lipoprotein Spr